MKIFFSSVFGVLLMIVHFFIYFDVLYNSGETIFRSGYFYAYLFICVVPIGLIFGLIHYWIYYKNRYQKKWISIALLEVIIFIEAIIFSNMHLYKDKYLLFIVSGAVVAFIMGWLHDFLMKRLFKK